MKRERMVVEVFDDLDYQQGVNTDADRSHKLMLDGVEVALDLTEAHSKELAAFLDPYLMAGTVLRKPRGSHPHPHPTMGAARERNNRIRAWAREHGRTIPNAQSRAWNELEAEYRAREEG